MREGLLEGEQTQREDKGVRTERRIEAGRKEDKRGNAGRRTRSGD